MKNIIIYTLCLSMTACASAYRPVVDTAVSPDRYEQDLSECRHYAGSDTRAGVFALVGGVIGAGFGILTAVSGHHNSFRNIGAGVGAISAGLGAMKGQRDVVARCMAGRGYSVLQ